MDRAARIAAAELLQHATELPVTEIADRLARVRDVEYWKRLAPDLAIGGTPTPAAMDDNGGALDAAASRLRRDRYCSVPAVVSAPALAIINRSIDVVVAAGWPAIFSIVYDAPWQCCRLPGIAQVIGSYFGGGFMQIPRFWMHVVPAVGGAAGWQPHFDSQVSGRLSVWIALTDATVDNGCMHLVPPDALPRAFQSAEFPATIAMADVLRALQATHALPIAAGGALAWDHEILHWGGRATDPRAPRRAMSLEFLSATSAPLADEMPLLDPAGPLPRFEERVRFVAAALRTYGQWEPLVRRFAVLAERLIAG